MSARVDDLMARISDRAGRHNPPQDHRRAWKMKHKGTSVFVQYS